MSTEAPKERKDLREDQLSLESSMLLTDAREMERIRLTSTSSSSSSTQPDIPPAARSPLQQLSVPPSE